MNEGQAIKWHYCDGAHHADIGPVRVLLVEARREASFEIFAGDAGGVTLQRTLDIPFPEGVPDAEVWDAAQHWAERIARAMWMYPATPDLLVACIWAREFIVTVAAEDLEIVQTLDAAIRKAGGAVLSR